MSIAEAHRQSRVLGPVRVRVVPGACFTPLQVLTILSETVTGLSEISLRRDRRAVVGPDSRSLRSGKLPRQRPGSNGRLYVGDP